MSDAQRWRDAMRALGLEWRVGMVDVDGDVARCDQYDIMMLNGCPVEWEQNFRPLRVDDAPDPHHPSNLGHLIDMVREVCPGAVPVRCEDGYHVRDYDHPAIQLLGRGDTLALAYLDALKCMEREVAK